MYRWTPTKPASCQLLAAGFMVLELPIVATLAIGTLVTWLLLRAAQAVEWWSAATHNLPARAANGIRLRALRRTFRLGAASAGRRHRSAPVLQNKTR